MSSAKRSSGWSPMGDRETRGEGGMSSGNPLRRGPEKFLGSTFAVGGVAQEGP